MSPQESDMIGINKRTIAPAAAAAKPSPSASMRLLQDHLASKRRLQKPNQVKQLPQASDHHNNNKQDPRRQIILESSLHKPQENNWDPEEEYDPMLPNSYELLQAEYLKAEEARLVASRLNSKKMLPNLLDVVDKLDSEDYLIGPSTEENKLRGKVANIKGTAIAPPPSLVSSSSTTDSLTDSGTATRAIKFAPSTTGSSDLSGSSSVAAKIMSKMGYKLGQGLGKDEQGISSPLEVEKSGLNSGRILLPSQKPVAASTALEKPSNQEQVADSSSETGTGDQVRDSTRVLLLQNMVGPGEVDDDLEAETKEECKKYGDVIKCLIYEIPNKRVPDNEAVRIFIEFRRVESAIKAASDLNGRYFGGRTVKASFYSQDKFNKYELAP